MSSLILEEKRILFSNGSEERVLLDFQDYLSNKSRLPLLGNPGAISLMGIFQELLTDLGNREGEVDDSYHLILDILVAKIHMASPGPKHILLLGYEGGILEAHFDRLISAFHPFSVLFPYPYEILTQDLGEKIFDLIMILGDQSADQPDIILKNAEKLKKDGGRIIISAPTDPLLEGLFLMKYPEREECASEKGRVIYMT